MGVSLEYSDKEKDLSILPIPRERFFVAVICTAAIISRWYGIGDWPIDGDEVFTYSRALGGEYSWTTNPAIYFIGSICFKLWQPSEFVLRLPAALFGILSIPMFYWVTRRLFGPLAAVFGGILVLFSAYHLDQSQFARYYAPVFFWATLSHFLYYRFFVTNHTKYLLGALVTTLIGGAFHVTFLVIPFANAIFALLTVLISGLKANPENRAAAKKFALLCLFVSLVIALYSIPIIMYWSTESGIRGVGYFGIKEIIQIVKYFGLPVSALALMGLASLLYERLFQGFYFAVLIVVPLMLFGVSSFVLNLRPDYIMSIYPLFFIMSGYYLNRLRDALGRKGYLTLSIFFVVLICMMPDFVSHYMGRGSLDWRKAVAFVQQGSKKGDRILSFEPGFNFYWADRKQFDPFIGTIFQSGLTSKLHGYENKQEPLWIVTKEPRQGIHPELKSWLLKNTKVVWELCEKRYDYTFRTIRVYLKE